MRKVWRFPLRQEAIGHDDSYSDEGEQNVEEVIEGAAMDIEMPVGAEILGVKNSSKGLILHAVVDPDAETERRSFFVCGNNVELPEGAGAATFRGTYKRSGGPTVHVFEVVQVTA